MQTVLDRRREFEAIGISPDREFIETALNVSLDDVDIFRLIADQEIIHACSTVRAVQSTAVFSGLPKPQI